MSLDIKDTVCQGMREQSGAVVLNHQCSGDLIWIGGSDWKEGGGGGAFNWEEGGQIEKSKWRKLNKCLQTKFDAPK